MILQLLYKWVLKSSPNQYFSLGKWIGADNHFSALVDKNAFIVVSKETLPYSAFVRTTMTIKMAARFSTYPLRHDKTEHL